MDPEDRVDGCAGRLLRKDVVMLVCAHCVECEEGHKEQAVSVPAHYDNELRRMYRELERTAAGALCRIISARQCPAQSLSWGRLRWLCFVLALIHSHHM